MKVIKTHTGEWLEHWVVASDKQRPVTVRRGKGPKFCCLSCLVNECRHVDAVKDHEASQAALTAA